MLEDSEGLMVNFRNAIILLTSNLGSDTILRDCRDLEHKPEAGALAEQILPELAKRFQAAMLGRLFIVPYRPLGDSEIQRIVRLKLGKIQGRFRENHRVDLTYDDDMISAIAERCVEVDTGARNVDHILTQGLLPELSSQVLQRMAVGERSVGMHVTLDGTGQFQVVAKL